MRRTAVVLLFLTLLACHSGNSPTEPRVMTISGGVWTGSGVCMVVALDNEYPKRCLLRNGCSQGDFIRPDMVRSDGSFDVDGTYGIVAGPSRQDPLPPAHYSGILTNTTLTLTVTPASGQPMTFQLQINGGASCPSQCV